MVKNSQGIRKPHRAHHKESVQPAQHQVREGVERGEEGGLMPN